MESGVLPPFTAELNLLLEWPEARTRAQWLGILGASVALHLILFGAAVRIPSLIGDRQAERETVVRRIPLYLPRDLMTQRAPNHQKAATQVSAADLTESREARPSPGGRSATVRRLEIPKRVPGQEPAKKSAPQILPQAPSVATNVNGESQPGILGGLPAAPPKPAPAAGPFQNIGDEGPLNAHPSLAPPKADVNTVKGLSRDSNSRQLIISDDVPERGLPSSAGGLAQAPAQHAAVELQSDPSGADFKAYLRNILTIVRGNWRRVVPESARMGMLRGRTVVEFVITRDGGIPKLVLADSSGSEPLDRAAVAGLSMSNPLPPLPADFKGFQVRLAFTFAYNLPTK